MSSRYLVTGALGCIGSWVVRNLVKRELSVVAYDLATDPHRMRLMMSPEEIDQVTFVRGDITNLDKLVSLVQDEEITHIIHLAALQVPACKANPPLGARVNVVGTVNVFEAARFAGLDRVIYASSVAAYGTQEEYDQPLIQPDDLLNPHTLYGVYKQANESMARVYWWDHGLSSIGLRPYVLYGPGRDQGMTSTPTKAMLAAAAGKPYHITYGGEAGMQYTDDVAELFIRVAQAPFAGAEVFNVKGTVVDMGEVVKAIEAVKPEMKGAITYESNPLPFPVGQDDSPLQTFLGSVSYTPLEEGVAATIATFEEALSNGLLTTDDL